MDIQGHTAPENDRFAGDASFIGNGYDWSGVGRATTGTAGKGGHWATLVSENVFLSAYHYHPATGTSLYFYPDNNPASSPVVRVISDGQRIGNTDLWIGHFEQAVPLTVSYVNRATSSLNSLTYLFSAVANENALVTGISPTGSGYGLDRRTSMAVGRNIIDAYEPDLTVGSTTAPALRTTFDQPGDSNLVIHEVQLRSGDSGGPLFIDDGGELQLVGINWAIGGIDIMPGPGEELREASYYSYVGNYNTEIQNYINANPASVPAPEPSGLLLLASGTLLLGKRKRCRLEQR